LREPHRVIVRSKIYGEYNHNDTAVSSHQRTVLSEPDRASTPKALATPPEELNPNPVREWRRIEAQKKWAVGVESN
jgi:hypothetical protein